MTGSVITGGAGFLGWHTRVLARALGHPEPVVVDRDDLGRSEWLLSVIDGADRVIHLAGVNRGAREDVASGNIAPAHALADVLRRCSRPPHTLTYANSVQAGDSTPYGQSKAVAAETLGAAAGEVGTIFEDIRLPNLFGEHGRPYYNSVVATFCSVLAKGCTPQIIEDRKLELMHVTDAAALLLGVPPPGGAPDRTRCTVSDLAERLIRTARLYRDGEIPEVASGFDVRLFNTFRSHCFPSWYPLELVTRVDPRGGLTEAVRVHGGSSQVFFSSTKPGVTRGEHFHLRKVERFVVLRGDAEIALRRVLDNDVVRFRVSGTQPVAVDIPTLWAHRITNVGSGELLTLFWSNERFDPARPDTYGEVVGGEAGIR